MYKITLNTSACTDALDKFRAALIAKIEQPFEGEAVTRELMFSIQVGGFNIWLNTFEICVTPTHLGAISINFVEGDTLKFKSVWNHGEIEGGVNQTLNWLINNIISANPFEVLPE